MFFPKVFTVIHLGLNLRPFGFVNNFKLFFDLKSKPFKSLIKKIRVLDSNGLKMRHNVINFKSFGSRVRSK